MLEDGPRVAARLLVGADSRQSIARAMLGIASTREDLQSSMLVRRVCHPRDHGGLATEWFDRHHTIAMLPLNGGCSSAVLIGTAAEIEPLATLGRALLGVELTRRYRSRLGAMTIESRSHVYPLATTHAQRFVAPARR